MKGTLSNRRWSFPAWLAAWQLASWLPFARMRHGQVYDPNVPVTVTDFYPDSEGAATQMILNGSNFGTDLNNIQRILTRKRQPSSVL